MADFLSKTRDDYNIISQKFTETRKKNLWIDLRPFLKLVKAKDRALDLGCGSGRLYRILRNKKIDYLGLDFSKGLLKMAKKDFPKIKDKFKLFDLTKERDWQKINKKYDVVLCIAVFHHLPEKKQHELALKQIRKALKKDGILILTVWNLYRKKFHKMHLKQIFWKIFKGFKFKWLLVPFKISDGKKVVLKIDRFMYGFTKQELESLITESGFKILKRKSGNNLCFAAKK